ncbi:MAG: phenylalanine--tRNA ligase subunit beta [Dehalococcoidia bacterium]
MKVSLKWLRDYVDIDVTPEDLAERLTMVGLEASDVQVLGDEWDNIYTGEVVNIERHPNADRLSLATVSLGQEQHTVVCGAPNIAVGQRVPFARVGARLFDAHNGKYVELKPARIRGVRSKGMVCSEKELGISDNHEGIMVLSESIPVGEPLKRYLGDTVFDITVTPNRPDCLNMIGIARETAALTRTGIHLPKVDYHELDTSTDEILSIEILDPDLCPRYCGAVIRDVKTGPSPSWMQERLRAAGMRPINNIVDITNFVMLEYGQPLHAFDYDKIDGGRIIVRRGSEGERMFTLDGEERQLTSDMLLICDATHPVAIAGVMGGEESEVTERTSNILLESANFNNVSIRHTSRRLGLVSEASSRFDKGLSRELPLPAARRAIGLMVELAGGKATRGIVDAYPAPWQQISIPLSEEKAGKILGIDFGMKRIKEALEALGFDCDEKEPGELLVTVPYWRTDVKMAEDLVEEVARIIGYEEIPTTMLSTEIPHHEPAPLSRLRERIRDILVGCGMQETINYSLTSREMLDKVRYQGQHGTPIRMANPLSREQEVLRTSLRGGLLNTFASNARHYEKGIMIFEIGNIYLPREGDLPDERETLCGLLGGPLFGQSWTGDQGVLDFFYGKGIVETMLDHLGCEAEFEPSEDALLFPGKTAKIIVSGDEVGVIGEVHPDVISDFDISSETVCLFEFDMNRLLNTTEKEFQYNPIPRFPSIDRDLALILDLNVPARQVKDIILSFPEVREAVLFDVYQGKQIPTGKKSLAFALRYQSMERTLTDSEVDRIQRNILTRLEQEVGAVLRQ